MRCRPHISFLMALSLVAPCAFAQIGLEVLPFGPTERLRPTGGLSVLPPPAFRAARNETESLQFAIRAVGGNLAKVDLSLSPFALADGTQLPAAAAVLFREVPVNVRHSSPRATEAPGLIPDALVPLTHPHSGEKLKPHYWNGEKLEGVAYGGTPFDLWQDHNEGIWLDVHVPADAAPGDYTATLRVTAENVEAVELPVTLTVWDFALPVGPTHENHFGGFVALADYHPLESDNPKFIELEERYSAELAAHRISPEIPHHLLPAAGEDGAAAFTPEVDAAITAFVERHHVTNFHIPSAPFGDPVGVDREKALRFYRSWYDYLEQKGWADRAYLYMLDEPNEIEAYERVRELGALVREAHPNIRRLVVEQTYTQDPTWPSLEESIDIWCPLFGFVDEASTKRLQAQDEHVWSYTALTQTAPPYHPEIDKVKADLPPFWEIDFPVTSYRIAPWLNRRYGITGLLYWSVVYFGSPDRDPWQDPGFRVRWNGEGALFYPGNAVGIDGPIASIRLKNLRDGMEDYEYFALLESLGGVEAADAIVREAVPTWGSWKSDPAVLPALRERLAEEILKRKGP
jgi:hypothetical protein